jgi:penicillin-binding protein 1C
LLFALMDSLTNGIAAPLYDEAAPVETFSRLRLERPAEATPPTILFPPPGSEVFPGASGGDAVVLAAGGGAGGYVWYVDGANVPDDAGGGRPAWRPAGAGFYDVTVVDAKGRSASAKVRVSSTD